MACRTIEPLPQSFCAPQGLFSDEDIKSLGADYLGDRIYTPGFTQLYQVTSGPLCRLFWNKEKQRFEPHSFESAWQQIDGKWQRAGPNFLSYQVQGDYFITPRWKPSLPEYWQMPKDAA
ncbi:MAG: hypothetical protein ACRCZS_15890 [Chroococcidiopsis sp.]